MTRKVISNKNVGKISEMLVAEVMGTYKEIGAAVECNDGKAKTIVWEG